MLFLETNTKKHTMIAHEAGALCLKSALDVVITDTVPGSSTQ